MKYSESIKPVSYFKSHAAEVIRDVVENQKTMIITQNGEAKVVVQDIKSYEKLQDSLALLKILSMSAKEKAEGKVIPAEKVLDIIRKEHKLKRQDSKK